MNNNDNVAWDRLDYTVISVTKTTAPNNVADEPWYQYIVGRSCTCLMCKRQGTLKQVTEHAENFAVDLNSRRGLKVSNYGRPGSKYFKESQP